MVEIAPAAELIDESEVIVCCGSGGVGKTTTAAAIGLEAARRGRRAVVVTIDPARRLADALGLIDGLPSEPAPVDLGEGESGELWAMMLDTAATFDGLVHRYAEDEQQAARILDNPFYRNIAGSLSGTQEYMAAEMLHALHSDERFDLVVVDTPPSRNALDFLEAPGVLSRFLDHRLFKLLMLPARGGLRVLNPVTQPVLRTIGKIVGSDVLADSVAFFQAFAGMETGFRERADEVVALIRAPETSFVVVAAPRHDAIDEAVWFCQQLARQGIEVAAALVNRCHPSFGEGSASAAAVEAAETLDRGHVVRSALWANVAHLRALREAERGVVTPLDEAIGSDRVRLLPLLDRDVHDLDGLASIGDHLFAAESSEPFESGREWATPSPE